MALFNSTIGPNGGGVYRQPVTVTLKTATGVGDRGQDTYTTTTVGTAFSLVENLSGAKLELARQLVAEATHQITMRYMPSVTPECQVTYGTRTFNVGAVVNVNSMNYELRLLCTEVV